MRARVIGIVVALSLSMLTGCAHKIIPARPIVTPPCSTSPPALPVVVTSSDKRCHACRTAVIFKDARGCEYRVYRDFTMVIQDVRTPEPRCLYVNAPPHEPGSELLDPDTPLGRGILVALQDWLERSFHSSEDISTADILRPGVLDVVDGLKSGLCASHKAAN